MATTHPIPMTLRDVYGCPVVRADTDLGWLIGYYYNHVPELGPLDGPQTRWAAQDQILTRLHGRLIEDHRRDWCLRSVWYQGSPIMVCVNAGREGDDHVERWVTDLGRYDQMVRFMRTLAPMVLTTVETAPDVVRRTHEFYGAQVPIGEERWTR